MIVNLTNENFLLYAAKYYRSLHYTLQEFTSDIKRISYIKRLIKRYKKTGVLSDRLILNHFILLYNVFEPQSVVTVMLFYRLDEDCYSALKTFLIFLNRMPEDVSFNGVKIISSDIPIDMDIANILRNI